MALHSVDFAIIALYLVGLVALAQWVSREKPGHAKNSNDYFLAGNSLPWWAIGTSLIAANISAEQIIGMSGSGFVLGLAIASYEWMAAITLLIVAKYFLPVFLRHRIYTMPQFLEQRYNHSVRMLLAIFWLGVYIFVNLTAILWLGALAINSITGIGLFWGLLLLAMLAVGYSLYGGLKAVAFTDIIQVTLLIVGGLVVTWVAMETIGNGSALAGFVEMTRQVPEKFDMILSPNSPHYMDLPGISVLIGGLWIMNLSYWGFNQYIIQRALAAKNLGEAQKGLALAAGLKLLIPLIAVLPGIAAVILIPDLRTPDQAYPEMMKMVPIGLRGLVFAALIAAILSSLGSMMNSISTIFTMDIVRHFKAGLSEGQLVLIGRLAAFSAMVLAVIAARPLLGQFDQAFQYIQEFTGFFTPGIVTIFLLGIFWRGTTPAGAFSAAAGSVVASLLLKILWPTLPFIDRVGLVFLICVAIAVIISLRQGGEHQEKSIDLAAIDFRTSSGFNAAAVAIMLVTASFYAIWW